MEAGFIIFIIGIIFSIVNSIAEQNKKNNQKKQQGSMPSGQKSANQPSFQDIQGKIKQSLADAKREYDRARQEIDHARQEIEHQMNDEHINPKTAEKVKKAVDRADWKGREVVREVNREVDREVNREKHRVSNRVPRETIKKSEQMQSIIEDKHLSEKQKKKRLDMIQEGDLTQNNQSMEWDKKAILNGIIMSEVLSKPKSRS